MADLSEIADVLRYEHGTKVDVDDRTLLLANPVNGDPGLSVLRVIGVAQAASPVGAAARGANGVAIGVWRAPELYVARWTNGRRWIVGYRLTGTARVSDYVSMEGRPPTRMETGNWYNSVPDEVVDAFLEVGLLLDEPPFPVPAPPPPPAARAAPRAARPPAASPRAAAAGPRPATARAARAEKAPTTRLCPSCRMHKAVAQFVPGSDLCVDCR